MNCSKCNALIVAKGKYDPEAEFLPTNNNLTNNNVVSSGKHEYDLFVCSNGQCPNHKVLLKADGTYFQIS